MLVGDRVVAVGWDDDATAAAIHQATAAWPDADAAVRPPVAFGIRSVGVGLLRRRIWLVHFGTPVRHRADDLTKAADFVRGLLEGLDSTPGDGEVSLTCRAYVARERAVLVHVLDDVDVDERPLRKRGIEQVPALATVLRPASSTVVHSGGRAALVGAVVDRRLLPDRASPDDVRRHLVSLAPAERPDWAWAVDRLGDRVVAADDLAAELRRLLA